MVDSITEKGNKFPVAMGIKAKLKVGGDGKWPLVSMIFGAQKGKGADLKTKLDTLFEDSLKTAPPSKVDEIKKAVTIKQDDDTVVVSVKPPKKEFNHEDQELKAALKEHKPEFSADFALARTIEDIMDHKEDNVGVAVRGIEAKIGAVFAESIIDALSHMPGLPPPAKATLGLVRSSKLRNEIYYDDDHFEDVPLPPLKRVLPGICHELSPKMAKDLKGLKDELAEVKQVVVEGLPYQWELTVDMNGINPGPIAEFCSK